MNENTTKFYKKLEYYTSDVVRCSITSPSSMESSSLGDAQENLKKKKRDKMENISPNHPSHNFSCASNYFFP